MDNLCVLCGKIIPEGRLVCLSCEDSSQGISGQKQRIAQGRKGYVEIVGPCSKYINGKGWTTQVPKSLIESYLEDKLEERSLEIYIFLKNIFDNFGRQARIVTGWSLKEIDEVLELLKKQFNIEVNDNGLCRPFQGK